MNAAAKKLTKANAEGRREMTTTSTMAGKPSMYEVNANGDRSFRSSSLDRVMSVARLWRQQGHEPHVYEIGDDECGRVTCYRIW